MSLRNYGSVSLRHLQTTQPWTVPYSPDIQYGAPHLLGSHVVLHASKTVGQLAVVFENLDHSGSEIDSDQVSKIAAMSADLVTEAMRLANLYQFDLAQAVVEQSEDKNGVTLPKWGGW